MEDLQKLIDQTYLNIGFSHVKIKQLKSQIEALRNQVFQEEQTILNQESQLVTISQKQKIEDA